MKFLYLFLFMIKNLSSAFLNDEKLEFCANLKCEESPRKDNNSVCGIRVEGQQGYRLRIFDNECQLLKFDCNVRYNETYGIINKDYCDETFDYKRYTDNMYKSLEILPSIEEILKNENVSCSSYNCSSYLDKDKVCGIRTEGVGFKVRLFSNNCELLKHNCESEDNFRKTYITDCRDLFELKTNEKDKLKTGMKKVPKGKNLIVINGPPLTINRDINESVNDFFASTHIFKLPLKRISLAEKIPDQTRRNMLIKIAGPQLIYEPITKIPEKRINDSSHYPFLASCFHSCPKTCPDHYVPVCGTPGLKALEPALVFKNHCFMDMAHCKMKRENKSLTADTSYYNENSFIFCVGEYTYNMLRFLPIVRTLQHMGRLKQKGKFYYRFRNFKYLNDLLPREGKHMG